MLKTAWRTFLGIAALAVASLQGLRALLSWGGEIDFVVSRANDPGWIGTALGWLLNPPPFVIIPLILIGLGLIYWDLRRRGGLNASLPSLAPIRPLPTFPSELTRANAKAWLTEVVGAVEWPTPGLPIVQSTGKREVDVYLSIWDKFDGRRATLAVRKESGASPTLVVQDKAPGSRAADASYERSRANQAAQHFLTLVANQKKPTEINPQREPV